MLKKKILSTKITSNQIAVFYLGQEGFIIKYKEKYILTDAYLSDYVDKNCCSENIKWIRKYDAPINASELNFIDYVFCTHSHYDHADPETLSSINRINKKARFIVSAAIKDTIMSYGINEQQIICAVAMVGKAETTAI